MYPRSLNLHRQLSPTKIRRVKNNSLIHFIEQNRRYLANLSVHPVFWEQRVAGSNRHPDHGFVR
jgi:hypothetical protein